MKATAHSRSRRGVVDNILCLFWPSICGRAREENVVIKQIHYIEQKHLGIKQMYNTSLVLICKELIYVEDTELINMLQTLTFYH